jgi:hypothetical protein
MEAATVLAENKGETPWRASSFSQAGVTGSAQASLNASDPPLAFNAGDSATPAFDVGETPRNGTFATSSLFGDDRGYGNLSGTLVYAGLNARRGTSDVLDSLIAPGATPFTPSSIGTWAHSAGGLKFVLATGATALLGLGFIAGLMRLRRHRSGHYKLHLSYHF